jgi:hypothetical protein
LPDGSGRLATYFHATRRAKLPRPIPQPAGSGQLQRVLGGGTQRLGKIGEPSAFLNKGCEALGEPGGRTAVDYVVIEADRQAQMLSTVQLAVH